ncbi:MAG: OsmC family protein [Planctomycetes bacterium]|nr:OsmC family protein [Planctomycetota bacterium]
MKVTFEGGAKFAVQIRGHKVVVDQPVEGGGTDEGPTPPEYFVASLGSCVGVYAVAYCERHNVDVTGMTIGVKWEKSASPARVSKIDVSINIPKGVPEELRERVLAAANHCLIHNTITAQPEINIALT